MSARLVIAALLALPAIVASGQRVSATVDAGGSRLRYADSISSAGATITPAVLLSHGLATFGASATLSAFSSGRSWQGAIAATTFTPSYRLLSGEIGTSLGGSAHEDGSRTGEMLGFGRAHLMGNTVGGWTGAGLGRTWDGASWRKVRQVELGGWAKPAVAGTVVGSVTPSAVDDSIKYTDAQIAMRWEAARADLGFTAGARAGSRLVEIAGSSRFWGGVNVIAWIAPKTAIVVSAGTYPLDFTQGYPTGRYVTLSLRLSSAKREAPPTATVGAPPIGPVSSFGTSRGEGTQIVFRVKAPSARSVEIIGDFTQWVPVAMRSQGDGWWIATLAVTPGTYQMNLRTDAGEWFVPPGMTAIRDELGGQVGIFIAPPR